MTALAQTVNHSERHLRAFIRQPWFVGIAITQPVIWLLLFGALFQNVTRIPGFETGSFQGIVGPNGIGREVIARLNGELVKVLNSDDMKQRFAKQGTEVRTGTPESLGQWLKTEQARWAKVVKESGEKFE